MKWRRQISPPFPLSCQAKPGHASPCLDEPRIGLQLYSYLQYNSNKEGAPDMMPIVVPRKPTSKAQTFRLTEEARRLLAAIAEKQGVDKTAMLEILIRELAEKRGIK